VRSIDTLAGGGSVQRRPRVKAQSNTQSLRRQLIDTGNLRITTWFPGTTL